LNAPKRRNVRSLVAVTLRCQETVSLLDSNIPLFTASMTFLAGDERSPADFMKQMLGDPRFS
jgi:hypothetical protein